MAFRRALEPGTAWDVLMGHHQGARFMCLRWTQLEVEPGGGAADRGERERYNIVALATEHEYPHGTVVRGSTGFTGSGSATWSASSRPAVPWTFYAGEDRMLEELERVAAPLREVPHEVWSRYGGTPRFLGVLGQGSLQSDV